MPAARGATPTGFTTAHAWMIVFVVLWLMATGLLVWVYTDQETVKKSNTELVAANRRLISESEKRTPPYSSYFNRADEQQTVVALMEQARAETAAAATGVAEDDPTVVDSKTRELTDMIVADGLVSDPSAFEGASLLDALEALYTDYRGLAEQMASAQARLDELNQKVEDLTAANTAQRDEFDERVEALQRQLADIEQSRSRYRSERDEEIAAFEQRIDEIRLQASRDVQEQRNQLERLEKDLDQVKTRYAQVQEKLGEQQIKPKPLQTLRQPDGVVLAAKPGEDVVYIDLGRDARLTLGLQFAVYSPERGIPADGSAKARIEVVSIYERSAACRIIELHGKERILENDLVANPIYDRDRPLKFMVIGEFDLDADEQTDADGVARLETLIEEWGGQIVDAVSARMDFIVVGSAPRQPRIVGEQTPEVLERLQEMREVYERYEQQVDSAESLGIPVLSQQVLLHFLGFRGERLALGL